MVDPLQALAAEAPKPAKRSAPTLGRGGARPPGKGDYSTLDVVAWAHSHGAYGRDLGDGKHAIDCPWSGEHSDTQPAEASDTVLYEPNGGWAGFNCLHAHCVDRKFPDLLLAWPDADKFCRAPFVASSSSSRNGHNAPDAPAVDRKALLAAAVAAAGEERSAKLWELAASVANDKAHAQVLAVAVAAAGIGVSKTGFLDLVSECQEPDKGEGSDESINYTKLLADLITADDDFAQDVGGKLYVYRAGVYASDGEAHVKRRVKALCIAMEGQEESPTWTRHRAGEVVEYIRTDAPMLWDRPKSGYVNLLDGILRTKTRELLPSSPEFLSSVQLPVKFDPAATCPAWDEMVRRTFPEDAQEVAWQVAAWLMLPNTSIQKAVLLTGEGSNGKSTFLSGITAFLGKPNIVSLSLQKMEAERFAAARLLGKLANICPDLPSAHLSGTSIFKAITGGDFISAEYKHRDGFDFLPFARLVFSCNHPPQSGDDTHAFFRRWLVVPFNRTFEPGDGEHIPRSVLDARLSTPAELSGLLNRALDALPGLLKDGFIESESMKDAWLDLRRTTDPIAVWLDSNTEDDPEALIPKSVLMQAYIKDCTQRGRTFPSQTAFGKSLRRQRPELRDAQRTVGGREQVWVWLGLRMVDPDPFESSRGSRGSRGLPLMQLTSTRAVPEEGPALLAACRENPVNSVNSVSDLDPSEPNPSACEDPPIEGNGDGWEVEEI